MHILWSTTNYTPEARAAARGSRQPKRQRGHHSRRDDQHRSSSALAPSCGHNLDCWVSISISAGACSFPFIYFRDIDYSFESSSSNDILGRDCLQNIGEGTPGLRIAGPRRTFHDTSHNLKCTHLWEVASKWTSKRVSERLCKWVGQSEWVSIWLKKKEKERK